VRIEFVDPNDVYVNFIEDDQYNLTEDDDCELFESNGDSQGPLMLPATILFHQYIICEYTYEPPAGEAGESHDNIVTINVGLHDCILADPTDVGTQDHECETQGSAITPGGEPGTYDVTAEASVLYLEVAEPEPTPDNRRDQNRPQPPNIGAGLSGLFNGMPTPLPTAPSAVAPAATAPTISPPRTGDAGLVEGRNTTVVTVGVLLVVSVGLAFGLRVRATR
jgi:hypothetical protein